MIAWCEDNCFAYFTYNSEYPSFGTSKTTNSSTVVHKQHYNGAYEPCSESYIYHLVIIDFT